MRRRAGAFAVVAVLSLGVLTGCTHAVEDATEQLKNELLAFDIVEYGYSSSREASLFDESFSSIQLDVAEDATAEQLDELVTYWRFGVDTIDARWMLGLTKDGGTRYDDFSVAGVRTVADLDAMVRFWHGLGPSTDSANVSLHDYSETSDGSVQLDLGPQPSAGLQGFMASLKAQSLELPGRFSWSIDAGIPAGTLSIAGDNVLPEPHVLDLLEAVAASPTADVGPIWFWAIESDDTFQPGSPMRLSVGVYLEPTSIDDLGVDTPEEWADLGDRVLRDPEVWPTMLEIADRLPPDETTMTLDFHVWGDQLAHLDPLECTRDTSEQVYGPLNVDLWEHWAAQSGTLVDCPAR